MQFSVLTRRIIAAKLTLPVYVDALIAWLSYGWLHITSTPRRKVLLLALLAALSALALWRSWYVASLVLLIPALAIASSPLTERLATRRLVKTLADKPRNLAGLSAAEATLSEMGIGHDHVAKILSLAADREFVVAELDQNNRVLSHVGDIPLYADAIISNDQFRKRSRNRMQIVIRSGVVAIRKQYSIHRRFANELISLDSLDAVPAVPKIISVDLKNRVLHQSYIPGKNLGSLMSARGATVSIQYRVGKAYSRLREPQASPVTTERSLLLRALHASVDREFIETLERLFVDIHREGVALRDIKHGNVLIYDGQPYWCDFDLSHRFASNSLRFLLTRDRERDRFNYLFDGSLTTLKSLERQLSSLASKVGPSLPKVYFGKGRGSVALSPESGTGRWRRISKHIPTVNDRMIIVLGDDASVAIGTLRDGAARSVMITADPFLTAHAKLLQELHEFIDNRCYSLELIAGQATDQLRPGPDANAMIVVLPSTRRSAVECLKGGLIEGLTKAAETVVIDCVSEGEPDQGGDPGGPLNHLLAELGFSTRRTYNTPAVRGILLVASRSHRHPETVAS
jgi:tRNA A-37 threonylcarbamoyl transferase component Bud32